MSSGCGSFFQAIRGDVRERRVEVLERTDRVEQVEVVVAEVGVVDIDVNEARPESCATNVGFSENEGLGFEVSGLVLAGGKEQQSDKGRADNEDFEQRDAGFPGHQGSFPAIGRSSTVDRVSGGRRLRSQ